MHLINMKSSNLTIPPILLLFLVFSLFLLAPVTQVHDSAYSMMLSQGLLNDGSFTLDRFAIEKLPPGASHPDWNTGYPYQLEEINGHLYYYFPHGSAVLSIPFVALLNVFGVSAVSPDGSYDIYAAATIQRLLAALLMTLLTFIFYRSARLYLADDWSWFIALLMTFGTSVFSTASRGLWADTWGIFLLGIAVLMLLKQERGQRINPVLLATILAWTYFVKPTYSISIAAISVFILLFHRKIFIVYALTGAVWCGLFVAYSWLHFGQLLPSYYLADRLGTTVFWTGLSGNLLSPARGLLVYSPFLILAFYLVFKYRHFIDNRRLIWLAMAIIVMHLMVVASFAKWWGGHSYGPRLMVGIIPWLALIVILSIQGMLSGLQKNNRQLLQQPLLCGIGVLLVTLGVLIHGTGAFSGNTAKWNIYPTDIDLYTERLWDWQRPQFMAGLQLLAADLQSPKYGLQWPVYEYGERIQLNQAAAEPFLAMGWSGAETDFRWTDDHQAIIRFAVDNIRPVTFSIKMAPFLVAEKVDYQTVKITFNSVELATFSLRDSKPRIYSIVLPVQLLANKNEIHLSLPDARSPRSFGVGVDTRLLGVAAQWFIIE